MFRYTSLDKLCKVDTYKDLDDEKVPKGWRWSRPVHKEKLIALAKLLSATSYEWGKRIEWPYIDIYSNSRSLYEELSELFADNIVHKFEPVPGTENQFTSPRTIVVKHLPHNKYSHKVFLSPHKGSVHERDTMLKFFKTHNDKIKCTPAVNRWIKMATTNYDRRYVLVQDEPTLLMLKLSCGKLVGSTYTFKIIDK